MIEVKMFYTTAYHCPCCNAYIGSRTDFVYEGLNPLKNNQDYNRYYEVANKRIERFIAWLNKKLHVELYTKETMIKPPYWSDKKMERFCTTLNSPDGDNKKTLVTRHF